MDVHQHSDAQIAAPLRRTRQRYSTEFKQRLVEQALIPDVSVARLALENGLNANLLRLWVSKHQLGLRATDAASDSPSSVSPFVRLPIARCAEPAPASVQVRLSNGVQIDLTRADSETLTTWLLALNALPCSSSTLR